LSCKLIDIVEKRLKLLNKIILLLASLFFAVSLGLYVISFFSIFNSISFYGILIALIPLFLILSIIVFTKFNNKNIPLDESLISLRSKFRYILILLCVLCFFEVIIGNFSVQYPDKFKAKKVQIEQKEKKLLQKVKFSSKKNRQDASIMILFYWIIFYKSLLVQFKIDRMTV